MISAPLLYKEHKQAEGWKAIFSEESHLEPDIRCGMHVHVPKSAFPAPFLRSRKEFDFSQYNAYDPARLTYLHKCFYSRLNRFFIQRIAERDPSNPYAPFDSIHYRGGPRYTGLNLNTHSGKTVEFRIFQSPNRFEKFLANLQLVDAFTSFFRNMDKEKQGLDWEMQSASFFSNGFYDFIIKNARHYDLLEKYIPKKQESVSIISDLEKAGVTIAVEDPSMDTGGSAYDRAISQLNRALLDYLSPSEESN